MRHHWLLLGACGWVLLILMFVTKFINFRATDGYGERVVSHNWTESGTRTVRVQSPEKTSSRPAAPASSAPSSPSEPWQAVIDQRNQLLQSVCKDPSLRNLTHNPVNKFVLDRIFVSDTHRILFCQTPKVGNTQWKKVLIVLNGIFPSVEEIPENIVHNHEKNGLPRLSSYSPPRSHTAAGLKFEDFVRYLGDSEGRHRLDRQFGAHIIHWLSYVELCAPCDITYDVIGHHETLEQDAPHILRTAGIQGLVAYPHIPPGITQYNRTKVQQYFSAIGKRDARRLYARYQGDFRLFGYERPGFVLD
ncbi:hypothetical protein WMY93_033677 [Mugilogobius chulae]|uniref:Carbohydrate sulfotransferase n=1 Tax=Mugilogobius chulae TaxID=88201 RepID=A0AAW0MS33_9GOBI